MVLGGHLAPTSVMYKHILGNPNHKQYQGIIDRGFDPSSATYNTVQQPPGPLQLHLGIIDPSSATYNTVPVTTAPPAAAPPCSGVQNSFLQRGKSQSCFFPYPCRKSSPIKLLSGYAAPSEDLLMAMFATLCAAMTALTFAFSAFLRSSSLSLSPSA